MKAIEFIENDIRRSRFAHRRAYGFVLAAGVFGLPILLGIGLRDSYEGVFDLRVFIPNLVATTLLGGILWAAFQKGFSGRMVFKALGWIVVWALVLATERVIFPPGARTAYRSPDGFWRENARCFLKGSLATGGVGIWISVFAFLFSSWPSRRWRLLLSGLAGASGAVMLGFHCDSSSLGHVLIGHVGQGIAMGAVVFLIQELCFRFGMRAKLPETATRVKNPSRIG